MHTKDTTIRSMYSLCSLCLLCVLCVPAYFFVGSKMQQEEEQIRQGGGAKAIARQHEKGRLTARERITLLLDPDAEFFELGLWAAWNMYKEWGGAPQSTIIGHGMKVPTPNAALVNAMMGHGIELDDAHGSGLIKAGSVLVPAAFALAELTGASGKDVITGVIAGYDLAIRIAR